VLPRGDKRCGRHPDAGSSGFRQFLYYLVVFFVLVSVSPVFSQEKDPSGHFPDMIHFYQKYISPVDGQRCSMYPSCSQYIRISIKKHGLLKGWVMGLDRLVRCGRDEAKHSSSVWINGEKHTYDSVENNDFWWSDK
jgi:putative membrane protein insertion efficiency factor